MHILTNYDNGNWLKIKDLMILTMKVSFLVESPSSDHLYWAATFISLESVGRGFLIVNPFKRNNSPVFATSIKRSSRAWYTCFGYILEKKNDVGKFSPRPVAAPIMHLVLVSKLSVLLNILPSIWGTSIQFDQPPLNNLLLVTREIIEILIISLHIYYILWLSFQHLQS